RDPAEPHPPPTDSPRRFAVRRGGRLSISSPARPGDRVRRDVEGRARDTARAVCGVAGGRGAAAGGRGHAAHANRASPVLREFSEPERRSEEALRLLEGVTQVFEELGDDLGLARALRLMADVHWTRGRYGDVDAPLQRAIEHAGKAGASAEQAASLRQY